MSHFLLSRPLSTSPRRAACAAGSITLTAALLMGAAPTPQAIALTSTTAGTSVGTTTGTSIGTTAGSSIGTPIGTTANTSAGTTVATVASSVPQPDLAADAFDRSVTGGWGTASVGGAWTSGGGAATYAVAGGAGTQRLGSGVTSAMFLNGVESTDTDTRVDIAFDRKAGSGPAVYASLLGRSVRGASDYRARLVVGWSGAVELQVARGANLLARTALPEVLHSAGARTTVRLQVTGTAPTVVRAKAWPAGGAEPADWQLVASDADPSMQTPGRLGLSTYASGNSTPIVASYSDLHVTPTTPPPNALPTAAFGASVQDLAVALDAAGSVDPDGAIAEYRWDHGDGTTSTGPEAAHTYAAGGTYPVTLTVTDTRGGTATTSRMVTVVAPNVLPTAGFSALTEDLSVTLDAAEATDADGTLASLVWEHGDGTTASGVTSRHVYAAPGDYPVTLTVTDDRGGRATTTRTVTAVAPNVLPEARFTAAVTDLDLAVDASSSADRDGRVTDVRWDFGDGTTGTGTTATRTYAQPGTYTVTATVTDDRGGSTTTSRSVSVLAPNVAPVAALQVQSLDLRATLDATASADSDGTIASYLWDHGDGTTSTSPTGTHTYARAGTYTVVLTVTDDRGGTSVTRRTVTAAAPRVAALHPFASTSVWNTAIGTGARFESAADVRTANLLTAKPTINRTTWSIPVFRATSSDVLGTLKSVRDNKTYQVRVPAAATGAAGSGGVTDGHATLIQPDGVTSYDTYKLVKVSDTVWEAQIVKVTDLRGSGLGGGVRAAGVPALAGLIRAHELREARIDHALAVAVPDSVLKNGWVFPARSQDANGSTAYYGQVPMGTLLALPRSVDVTSLGLSPEGLALARALQNYGGYVVDRAGTAALYCEVDCDGTATTRMTADWKVLFPQVRVVSNSSATSIGGGGEPTVSPLGSAS